MRPGARITSHSCKCTCLSYLAKRGASFEDRLVLGYHANKLRMAMTYSRDSAARPLALLSRVLGEIRDGIFEPDNTRSGRLKPGAKPLESDLIGLPPNGESVHVCSEPATVEEVSDLGEHDKSAQSVQMVDIESAGQPEVDGHLTTDSSDSSDNDMASWAPVVGHYHVEIPDDKQLWLNVHTKMYHLSHNDHERVLLCSRRISANFKRHTGPVRFDAAKCRQCFRLRDESR